MEQINNKYMSDPVRAKRVIQNFISMTLRDFSAAQQKKRDFVYCISATPIYEENLDGEKAKSMDYLDIACLAEHIPENPDYWGIGKDKSRYSSRDFQMFVYKMILGLLLDIEYKSTPVRMFLALPVKVFYESLENNPHNRQMQMRYEYIKRAYQKLYFNNGKNMDNATIKDILNACDSILRKPWESTLISIENYRKNILNTYDVIEGLLGKSFRAAFSERFQIEEVCSKYGRDYEEDYEDIYEEDDEEDYEELPFE